MTALFIWLCFAVICFLIAKEKNRNGTTAFFCGLFFGIFALIYYIIVDKKE